LLVGLTACASSPRGPAPHADPDEAERAALRYELRVLTAGAVRTKPVQVDSEDFQRKMRALALAVRPDDWSRDTARWLLEQTLEADLFAETEHERVLRMVPLEDDSPLATSSNAERYWKANLLESEARGRYVHAQLEERFPHLEWKRIGVDAVDPATGIQYEILTRTESNMARHGRRMAEELFRMIGF
jgi:hypothetical protein